MADREKKCVYLKEAELRKQIKTKLSNCYFFFGEEDYMKKYAINAIRDLVVTDLTFAPFNEIVLNELDFSPDKLLSAIQTMPVMAEKKLIYVTSLDIDSMKVSVFDELIDVMKMIPEYDYNVVVISTAAEGFDFGVPDRRPSNRLLSLSPYCVPVYFEQKTPAQLIPWAEKHFVSNGVNIDESACAYLVSHCGVNMFSLSSEIDKVSYYVLSQGRLDVSIQDIDKVSVSSVEFDAFSLTNAIVQRNRYVALEILCSLKSKKSDPLVIMSEITNTICNMYIVSTMKKDGLMIDDIAQRTSMHSYVVKMLTKYQKDDYSYSLLIERCKRADIELKLNADGYSVIESFICRI